MPRLQPFRLPPLVARLHGLGPAVREFGRELLDLALPPRCLACNDDLLSSPSISLCQKCTQMLAPELPPYCGRCGAELPEGFAPAERCPTCHGAALKFDTVFPMGHYEGALRDAVLRTKRSHDEAFSLTLGRLMAMRLQDRIAAFRPDAIIPIPMHWMRRIARGTNGAELLAECLATKLKLPLVRTLVRQRYTRPQKELSPGERYRNIRGAFAIRRRDRQRWEGARLLVVDDILTTGATCSEAARLLKRAGAEAVAVAVVARAESPVYTVVRPK